MVRKDNMKIVMLDRKTLGYDCDLSELEKLGEEIGVIIKCQREDIFNSMHRI